MTDHPQLTRWLNIQTVVDRLTQWMDDIDWQIMKSKIKNGKAGGQDGLINEFIKYEGPFLQSILIALFSYCISTNNTQKAGKTAKTTMIPKSGR